MEYVCEGCGQEGDAADFLDLKCTECGARVVSLEEAARNKQQYKDFLSPKHEDLGNFLDEETDF